MAQFVVAAAGAVAGFMIGGPTGLQIGWTLGRAAYSMANPARSYGPRLSDLKVTGTEYGQPIQYCFGHPRLAGQLVYASQKYEIADTQSAGKGGGQEYTSYTYEVDLLYLLTDNEMAGVTRIWMNGELIWTNLVDPANPDVSLSSIIASINSEKWQRMTVYTGGADQLPDPDYEAAVTNAPAYRGRTTVFIKRLKLGNSGQIPQLTFEVTRTAPPIDTGVSDMGVLPAGYPLICYNPLAVDSLGARSFVADWTTSYPSSSTAKLYRIGIDGTVTVEKTINVAPTGECAFLGFADAPILLFKKENSYATESKTVYWWTESGVRGEVTLPESVGFSQLVYAFQSGVIYIGSFYTWYSNTIYRVENAGYSASLPLPEPVQSIVECAGYLYCAGYSTSSKIYKLNADTLEYIGYITKPGSSANYSKSKLATGSGQLYAFDGSNGYTLVGATWETAWTAIGNASSIAATVNQITGMYGANYWSSAQLTANQHIYSIGSLGGVRDDVLQTVVEMLCDRAGMPSGSYDASALASITKPVRSLAISQVGGTRATLEMLMQSHYFGCYVTDKLRFIPRGGASVATIPFADLGATIGETVEPLALRWANELELPATVSITYANVDGDYNTATEESDRLLTSQGSTSALQLALGMTSAEAKGVANTSNADNVAALLTSTIHLPSSYSHLTPTDVVTVLDRDGSSYRMRITKRTDSAGVLQLEVVRDDAQALQDVGISSTDYTPSTTVAGAVDTLMVPLDTPLLRDEDDSPAYMLAARGTGRPWPGGAGYVSADGGTTYTQAATFTASSVIGTTTTALPAWTGIGMDTANTVTVTLGDGQQLASTTRSALFADETLNALMFESGELVRFLTATLVSGSTYTLSGLLRGCRGTEWAMGMHSVGEDVVLLGNALRRVSILSTEVGAARKLKGVTANRALSTGTVLDFTAAAVCLKPLAPVQGAYAGGVLSWRRRSRYATQLFGPAGPVCPLGESVEAYEIDLIDASDAVVSTITSSSPSSTISGYTVAGSIAAQADMRQVGSLLIGVNEAYPNQTDADVLTAWQPDGSAMVASANLGGAYAWQVADDGTYVYTAEVTPSGGSAVRKWSAASISSGAVATYSTASGNAQGVACVGSIVWASEYYTQRLVQLDSAMTEVGSYSLTGISPRRMHYDGTSLWVCLTDGTNFKLLQHDPATNTEVQRITLADLPYDVRSNGTVVVVACYSAIYTYLVADGSLIATIPASLGFNGRGGYLATNGSQVFAADVSTGRLLVISSAGLLEATAPITGLRGIGGIQASGAPLAVRVTGSPATATTVLLSDSGAAAAVKARVYQLSSVVGRGYPLEIPLT